MVQTQWKIADPKMYFHFTLAPTLRDTVQQKSVPIHSSLQKLLFASVQLVAAS